MKLITYEDAAGRPRPGALARDDTRIIPLDEPARGGFSSVQDLIEAGDEGLARAREAVDGAGASDGLAADSVHWLSPIPRPVQIRDALCFLDHMRNAQRAMMELLGASPEDVPPIHPRFAEVPLYYKANRMYVVGYTIFNDVSARDLQGQEMPASLGPAKGKDFDTGNVLGPCIVTADEVDVDDLAMIARVNGEEISRGSTRQMDHKVEDVVSYISRGETIYPGEIFGSGTVPLGGLIGTSSPPSAIQPPYPMPCAPRSSGPSGSSTRDDGASGPSIPTPRTCPSIGKQREFGWIRGGRGAS